MLKELEELFGIPAPDVPMEADTILSSKELTDAVSDYLRKHNRIPEGAGRFWVQYWNQDGHMTARIAFCEENPQARGKQ